MVSTAINWYPEESQAWTPPEQLLISEWAEKYRILTEPAEEKGPLRLRRTPYLIPILDVFQEPSVEQVVFCKPAQIAGTEAMISLIGYYAHQEPCPIMLILADEDTAGYMSRERIQKMFTASPELSKLIIPELMNRNEITLMNGSYIALGWASSVAKLASRPIRCVVFDEVDKPGYYTTSREAGPISLGIERTETFYGRKIGLLSTPTDENGNITRHLESCDAVFDFHVPCPSCGMHQPLRWSREYAYGFPEGKYRAEDNTWHDLGQVVWEGGRNAAPEQIANAGYECGHCGAIWDTVAKNNAVERGIMVSRQEVTYPPKKVGFHINRLYSLLGKSGDIPKLVEDFIRCKKSRDPKDMQGFVNSTLAEPWKQVIVHAGESEILKARVDLPPQTVPEGAAALTCGIDCQRTGFWYVVRAWAREYTSWLIDYGTLPTWDDIEQLLFSTEYPMVSSEHPMRIWRAAIDTGGGEQDSGVSMTEEAYFWIRRNGFGRGCRVMGTKGSSKALVGKMSLGKVLDKTPSNKPIPGGLQLVMLDTAKLKDTYHYRLQQAIEQQPGGAYLHSGVDHVYVAQILAEEKRRNRKGLEEWVQVKRDNHLLDCECMAMACADPEWPGGGVHLVRGRSKREAPEPEPSNREGVRSDWLKPKQNSWFSRGR